MNKYGTYKKVKIDCVIPAFDKNQQGLTVDLQLCAIPRSQLMFKGVGSVAKSLERNFIRVIEIMSSLKSTWSYLEEQEYTLMSFNEHYKVKDARSADLSFCIAALNVVRVHKQMKSVDDYVGTGTLRIDGSFNQTLLEAVKEKAVLQSDSAMKKFITAKSCEHIFDLDVLLNGF